MSKEVRSYKTGEQMREALEHLRPGTEVLYRGISHKVIDTPEHGRRIAVIRDDQPDGRQMTVEELQEEHALQNPIHQVYFRAGLIACREHMAGFVESTHPEIAESIRANWWPQLGGDFGPPRKLDFAEVADGGEEGPWTVKPLSPTQEALPIALGFLETCKP